MPDTNALFVAALADRYRVERELGRGGMLRSDPEPALRPDVEQVRAELAKLTGPREVSLSTRPRLRPVAPRH